MTAHKKNLIVAGLIAAAFIGIILFSGPITALNVTITPDQSSYIKGVSIATFSANLTINNGENVPVQSVKLGLQAPSSPFVYCDLPMTSTNDYNCNGSMINITVINSNYTSNYGYGYRQANSSMFSWGYGYGYGGSSILGYVIRWAVPSAAVVGTYTASFTVTPETGSPFVGYTSFTVNAPTTTTVAPTTQATTQATTTSTTTSTTTTTVGAYAPLIYDVDVKSVTVNSATIIWKTDKAADSVVEYGTTASYGASESSSSTTEDHSIALSGLAAGTTYHFRVKSTDGGLTQTSVDYSFTTSKLFTETTTLVANETTSIDVPQTDIEIEIVTGVTVANATINISTSSNSQTGSEMSVPGLNKFVKITVSPELAAAITSVVLRIDYTDEEVLAAGLNESSMGIYWYSGTEWVKLSTALSWVKAAGVDTVQNYVWANVTHFSDYTVGGDPTLCTLKGNYAPCVTVSLEEVLDIIDLWARDEATIPEVVAIINAWAVSA
jgi:hypothetical protein